MDQVIAAPNDTPTVRDVPHWIVEEIAMIAHKINQEYCYALDPAYRIISWAYHNEAEKNSIRFGVHALLSGKYAGPEDQHKGWLETKTREGWKWGPVKDLGAKEHPCLMAYDLLPIEQRMKDSIFRAVVLGAAAKRGFAV